MSSSDVSQEMLENHIQTTGELYPAKMEAFSRLVRMKEAGTYTRHMAGEILRPFVEKAAEHCRKEYKLRERFAGSDLSLVKASIIEDFEREYNAGDLNYLKAREPGKPPPKTTAKPVKPTAKKPATKKSRR